MVSGPVCPVCTRPMYGRPVEVTTFGDDDSQWVAGTLYCPTCVEESLITRIKVLETVGEELAAIARWFPQPHPDPVIQALDKWARIQEG